MPFIAKTVAAMKQVLIHFSCLPFRPFGETLLRHRRSETSSFAFHSPKDIKLGAIFTPQEDEEHSIAFQVIQLLFITLVFIDIQRLLSTFFWVNMVNRLLDSI